MIGQWVRREHGLSKWHHVESEIEGAAITHCGRRMEPKTEDRGGLIVELEPVGPRCERCT